MRATAGSGRRVRRALALALVGLGWGGAAAAAWPASADPVAQPGASATVPVRLVCGPSERGPVPVAFGVPFARDEVTDPSRLRLRREGGDARDVPATIDAIGAWHRFDARPGESASVRAVRVALRIDCGVSREQAFVLDLDAPPGAQVPLAERVTEADALDARQAPPAPGEGPRTDDYDRDRSAEPVLDPRVWAVLPAERLRHAEPWGPTAATDWRAWREARLGFGRTYVNDVPPDVREPERNDGRGLIDWATEVEGWLYDRPAVLWNLYVQTGDLKWLRHAHRATAFYASWLDRSGTAGPTARGAFRKKPVAGEGDRGDPKYSTSGGLLAAWLLSGRTAWRDAIEDVAAFVGEIPTRLPPADRRTGLWTERQVAVALSGAINAYQATGRASHRERADAIVAGLVRDARSPPSGYPEAPGGRGVLLHRAEVHEGEGRNGWVLSPWMSALLMEAVWRHAVAGGGPAAMALIADTAAFVAERGLAPQRPGDTDGPLAPMYLVSIDGAASTATFETDVEHAPDVLGLMLRGRSAAIALGRPVDPYDRAIRGLRLGAVAAFDSARSRRAGTPPFRLAPTRKYGWWFASTHDIGLHEPRIAQPPEPSRGSPAAAHRAEPADTVRREAVR